MNDKPKIILLQSISIKYTLKLLNSLQLGGGNLLIFLRQAFASFAGKIVVAFVGFGMPMDSAEEVVAPASKAKIAHFFSRIASIRATLFPF